MFMTRLIFMLVLATGFGGWSAAQQLPAPGKNQEPPRSERNKEAGESSSRDTRIDLSPPKDDAKNHPNSGAAVSDGDAEMSPDVQEFHPWDPHKALKDIEVGDFYLKRKNYRAALDRYQEALVWKPNDAIANFRMAQCFEKLSQPEEARTHYEEYLRILPHGPLSAEAQKGLEKLKGVTEKNQASGKALPKQ
jgi:tetratricopeptide (TPR) repeat protein